MPSLIAWLDVSEAEQRRMRELVAMFSQSESVDELGIGQIRDALSDLLFPGTSSLLTRARYALFVPWLYQRAVARHGAGKAAERQVDVWERSLIEVLRKQGATDGLIGRIAGPQVKILPSTIYWSLLQRWGVLTAPLTTMEVCGHRLVLDGDADEIAERANGVWSATMPPAPTGFPNSCEGGFDLTRDEAEWLAERIVTAADGSLLAHLVVNGQFHVGSVEAPWVHPAAAEAPPELADVVGHARRFSLAMHGPALLYNRLVGERYEQTGFTTVEAPVQRYTELLESWADEVDAVHADFAAWDRQAFWHTVLSQNGRVSVTTRAFVDRWIDLVAAGEARRILADPLLARLVEEREISQKAKQARLKNPKALEQWQGASGVRLITYRWPQVQRVLQDINDGRNRG